MSGVKGMKHRKRIDGEFSEELTIEVNAAEAYEQNMYEAYKLPLETEPILPNINALTVKKAELIRRVMEGMLDTFISKNSDYGDSFSRSIQDFGITAGVIRIGDKYNRMRNLTKRDSIQRVEDETIRDTLLDMANYCIMTVMEMDLLKGGRV